MVVTYPSSSHFNQSIRVNGRISFEEIQIVGDSEESSQILVQIEIDDYINTYDGTGLTRTNVKRYNGHDREYGLER